MINPWFKKLSINESFTTSSKALKGREYRLSSCNVMPSSLASTMSLMTSLTAFSVGLLVSLSILQFGQLQFEQYMVFILFVESVAIVSTIHSKSINCNKFNCDKGSLKGRI